MQEVAYWLVQLFGVLKMNFQNSGLCLMKGGVQIKATPTERKFTPFKGWVVHLLSSIRVLKKESASAPNPEKYLN